MASTSGEKSGSTAADAKAAGAGGRAKGTGTAAGTGAGGRARYHHGDLRNALIVAAVTLAAEGGPEQVVLREAARRVGVSPTAAYRHFAGQQELLHEVRVRGQLTLATAMENARAAVAADDADPGRAAELRLIAIGRAYVDFAVAHPGLYRAAFCNPVLTGDDSGWTGVDPAGPEPEYRAFVILSEALDALAGTGRMPEANRPGAEITAWSLTHGLSMLILEGPMGSLGAAERDAVIDRSIATIAAGLTSDPGPSA